MHVFTNNFEYVVGNNSLISTSPTYAKADTGVYRTFIKTVHISHLKMQKSCNLGQGYYYLIMKHLSHHIKEDYNSMTA